MIALVLYLGALATLAIAFRRTAGRFVLGHHLTPERRTNYGAFVRANRQALHARSVTGWGRASMLTRAGVRLATLAAGAGVTYGLASAPGVTLAALESLAAVLACLGTWRLVILARTWRHRRQVVSPLASALAPLLGVDRSAAVAAIQLPRTFARANDGPIGHVLLPDHFQASPDQRKAVDHLVSSRLPVDIDLSWKTTHSPGRLEISASPKPPAMVRLADLREELDACQPGDIVIGLDRRRNVYRGSFRTEDPHWGFSVGSGRGKSSFLQVVAAQVLHQDPGATVTGVDPKMSSLDPLIGIPGVKVANDPRNVPGMWAAISGFREEMERRMDQRAEDPTTEFPLALLVLDEVNQFAAMTSAVWREMKEKGDPATAPIWMEVASLLWQGRAFNCHVILVGQRLDDRATGGIGLRDSLGLRGLGGFTAQQWMMLIGTTPVARSQRPRGRWIYSDGQETTWVQNLYMAPEEVRAYALEGRRESVATSAPDAPLPAETAGSATDTTGVWVIGLDAAATHLGLSPAAFRKRRERAGGTLPGEIRKGNQPAWTVADLASWRATWPRVVDKA